MTSEILKCDNFPQLLVLKAPLFKKEHVLNDIEWDLYLVYGKLRKEWFNKEFRKSYHEHTLTLQYKELNID